MSVLEVQGVVEIVDVSGNSEYGVEIAGRSGGLTLVDGTPPICASQVWQPGVEADTSLEVLVRALRLAMKHGYVQERNHIIELIIARTQAANERWARRVLEPIPMQVDERMALMGDLCADLYESMIRALFDPQRRFWEENFLHCLYFERKHVYKAFMMREGRWRDVQVKTGERIPRTLLASLERSGEQKDGEVHTLEVEDERAREMLLAVEWSDLLEAVLRLPERFKAVVLLIFWEGRSEKDTARLLKVTDRTVRNRVREALKRLRDVLEGELHG